MLVAILVLALAGGTRLHICHVREGRLVDLVTANCVDGESVDGETDPLAGSSPAKTRQVSAVQTQTGTPRRRAINTIWFTP